MALALAGTPHAPPCMRRQPQAHVLPRSIHLNTSSPPSSRRSSAKQASPAPSHRGRSRDPAERQIVRATSTDVSTGSETVQGKVQGEPSKTGLNVLVTGSTKGVGYALAREFLLAGDNVVITSRTEDRVEVATSALRQEFGEGRVWGQSCDVADFKSVAALAEFAWEKMGRVDVWINNAGTNAYFYGPIIDCDEQDLEEIVRTNMLGIMLCCRQAIKLMKEQDTGGHIFNMDGAGADGNATPRFAAYGATKRSLAQFTKSLQAELKMLKIPKVVVHNLSPGMVTTELLMSGADTPTAKFFINALAEPADEVARFLVPRVREVVSAPSPAPSYIRFLTRPKAFSQILQRVVFQARKGRYVAEE